MKSKTKLVISSALALALGLLLTKAMLSKRFPEPNLVSNATLVAETTPLSR